MILELLLIALVALIVVNPKRLPEIMYTLGVWLVCLQGLKKRLMDRYYRAL